MNNELLEVFSIINTLKKNKQKEIQKNESYLRDEINSFKGNQQVKPTLSEINDELSRIIENPSGDFKKDILSLFEDFVRCAVNEIDDFKTLIEMIQFNLEKTILFIEGTNNDLLFSFDYRSSSKLSDIEPKIEYVERLIQERNEIIQKLYDDIM
tara:strand:- start:1809 stop:2270 length:462 start_codon:yes stop_codon:yes gene_type:complete